MIYEINIEGVKIMTLIFSMNYIDELMTLVIDDNYNVINSEVKNRNMCDFVIKPAIPNNNESLIRFFHTNMGGNNDIKAYIDHICKYGFYNPYERNLRISMSEG